jgi:hypothetical protein
MILIFSTPSTDAAAAANFARPANPPALDVIIIAVLCEDGEIRNAHGSHAADILTNGYDYGVVFARDQPGNIAWEDDVITGIEGWG